MSSRSKAGKVIIGLVRFIILEELATAESRGGILTCLVIIQNSVCIGKVF